MFFKSAEMEVMLRIEIQWQLYLIPLKIVILQYVL